MINIDIRAKKISEDHSVVVARPGAGYALYPEFVDESVVGPDMPSVFLEGEEIKIDDDIVAKIKRSRERRSWHKRNDPLAQQPSEDADEYDNLVATRSVRQFERILKYYIEQSKRDDLIVIPPKNFTGKAFIGSFSDDAGVVRLWNSRIYPADPLPVRNVRWLGSVEKIELAAQTIDALRTPTALFLLERSLREPIYQKAYRNYFFDGGSHSAVFDVTEPEFNTYHGSIIPSFFNFVAANVRQIDRNQPVLDFMHGSFQRLDEYAPDLIIDIQSPGILSIVSDKISPLVASALLALALTIGPDAASEGVIETIRIGNSLAAADDPCVLEVEQQVHAHLTLLGYDDWARACELVREAAADTGLKSESLVRNE